MIEKRNILYVWNELRDLSDEESFCASAAFTVSHYVCVFVVAVWGIATGVEWGRLL